MTLGQWRSGDCLPGHTWVRNGVAAWGAWSGRGCKAPPGDGATICEREGVGWGYAPTPHPRPLMRHLRTGPGSDPSARLRLPHAGPGAEKAPPTPAKAGAVWARDTQLVSASLQRALCPSGGGRGGCSERGFFSRALCRTPPPPLPPGGQRGERPGPPFLVLICAGGGGGGGLCFWAPEALHMGSELELGQPQKRRGG